MFCSGGHDPLPGADGTSQARHADLWVLRQLVANHGTWPGDKVDNPGWNANLVTELGEF